MKIKSVILTAIIYFFSLLLVSFKSSAGALDTLPAGINSPMVRLGNVEGIGQRYTGDSTLMTLGDYRSVVFDAENLMSMNERAQALIQALDQFGTQALGSNISYGVFKVQTTPQVQYTAPVYARGITNNWTLAVAIPIINYKNNIYFTTENSNLAYYRDQLSGISPELDDALNIDIGVEAQNTFRSRGYKPLTSRSESYMGDVQVASLYNFWKDKSMTAQYSMTLNLPTGPEYDPDDLAALNIFGRTSIDNKVYLSRPLNDKIELVPYAGLLINIPDRVTARVPKDQNDVIPDQNSKEEVTRIIGPTATIGGDAYYTFSDSITVGAGYSISEKAHDKYDGDEGRRYDLLGRNTNSAYHRINAGVSYSTVKSYFKKTSLLPAVVSLNVSDTIWGRNVERRTMQELNFMMFF